ncbi:MAG: YncE family protein, partial [Bacteroidales bacterium]|nr:YncE family protein [Bacteroidales bacterium]
MIKFSSSIALLLTFITIGCQQPDSQPDTDTGLSMPYNKILNPAGEQITFGDKNLENHALDVALSPDKKTLAVEGRYSIVFVNTSNNNIISRFVLRSFDIGNAMNSYSGISWTVEDGKQILLWGTRNQLMKASWDGKTATIVKTYKFTPKANARASIPNEMVINKEGNRLMVYLVLNGNDEVVKLELASGKIIWQRPVGLAPYGITLSNGKLYVSNWAGSVVSDSSQATAGIPWGSASVDERGTVNSGSVSILDTETGTTFEEIKVGLHPNHIIESHDGKFVYVANGNDDNISVISTSTHKVVETIDVRLNKEENPYFGDSPNGLAISSDDKILYVANGMDNALAVIKLSKTSSSASKARKSKTIGFIPTAAYPGGIDIYKDSVLYVANIEGIGARATTKDTTNRAFQSFMKIQGEKHSTAGAFNSHRMLATVSAIPIPGKAQLKIYTKTVNNTNQQSRLALLELLPRKNTKAVPVPERIGEPSVFKHVVYIIKENRTYDQILGDVQKGNGDASLCAFGQEVTPNAHKLTDEYVLMDNYKASGKCSAEGHLWTDASTVTDYIEKNVRAWFRSYTHVLYDAMAYP